MIIKILVKHQLLTIIKHLGEQYQRVHILSAHMQT